MRFRDVFRERWAEWIVLLFSMLAVLWRGGKTLEITWLLTAVSAFITVSWWVGRPKGAEKREVSMWVWVTSVLFIAWTVLSFLTSTTQNYGLDEVLREGAFFLLFLWAARLSRREDADVTFHERLAITLTVAALTACAVGMLVYALQPVSRFVGTFFDWRFVTDYWPNAWAELLLLCWPMALFSTRRLHSYWRILILGPILGCLFLSFSRGAFLSLIGQGILLLLLSVAPLLFLKKGEMRMRLRMMGAWGLQAIAIVVVGVLIFFTGNVLRSQFHTVESVAAKATFTSDEGLSSVSERREFWDAAIQLSKERPLTGWGPYSFRFVQPRLQTAVFATSDHPHNVFLKLAMERGWPAAGLYTVLLALILVPFLWNALRRMFRGEGAVEMIRITAFVAVAGVLAHNMIDYNLQFVGIALPLTLLLGRLTPVERERISRRWPKGVDLAFATVLLCVAVLEGRYLITSSLGRRAEARGQIADALRWYQESRGEMYSRDMHLSRASLALDTGNTSGALSALSDYLRQNTQDARAWKLLGDANALIDDGNGAFKAYKTAWKLGKFNYIGILGDLLTTAEQEKNMQFLQNDKHEIDTVFTAFSDAILHNVHFIDLSQNVEAFARIGAQLARLYPEEAEHYRSLTKAAVTHAAEERVRLKVRPQGALW